MEPEDIFSNEATARQCAHKLNARQQPQARPQSTSMDASLSGTAPPAAALFGGNAPTQSPEKQIESTPHDRGDARQQDRDSSSGFDKMLHQHAQVKTPQKDRGLER
jgi:hypothetical protein